MVTNITRMLKGRDGRFLGVRMGSKLKSIYSVELLDARERLEEQKWDAEFRNRQRRLAEQRQECDEKRKQNRAKLAEMSARWHSLEEKRVRKSELYLERLKTSLSMNAESRASLETGSRQNTFTPTDLR